MPTAAAFAILAARGWSESIGPAPDRLDSNDIAVAQMRPPVLSVSSNLVLIDVSVLDQAGRPVRGLPTVAFHLFERGAEQRILSVSETEVPVSVIIVLDESGSMGWGVTQCAQAVKQFLKSSTEGDEFALISFSDRLVLESDFTTDAGAIQARLMGRHGSAVPGADPVTVQATRRSSPRYKQMPRTPSRR